MFLLWNYADIFGLWIYSIIYSISCFLANDSAAPLCPEWGTSISGRSLWNKGAFRVQPVFPLFSLSCTSTNEKVPLFVPLGITTTEAHPESMEFVVLVLVVGVAAAVVDMASHENNCMFEVD